MSEAADFLEPAVPAQLTIRTYRSDDTEDMDAIERITMQVFGPGSIDFHLEQTFGIVDGKDWKWRKRRHVTWDLAALHSEVFVAEEDGEVVGFISVVLDLEASVGRMVNLAVAEHAQNHGLAHSLIQRSLEYIKASGCTMAKIETLVGNEKGEHIFPTLGFTEVARQIHYFKKLEG